MYCLSSSLYSPALLSSTLSVWQYCSSLCILSRSHKDRYCTVGQRGGQTCGKRSKSTLELAAALIHITSIIYYYPAEEVRSILASVCDNTATIIFVLLVNMVHITATVCDNTVTVCFISLVCMVHITATVFYNTVTVCFISLLCIMHITSTVFDNTVTVSFISLLVLYVTTLLPYVSSH